MSKRLKVWYIWSEQYGQYACVVGNVRITCKASETQAKQWVADINKYTDQQLIEFVDKARAAFANYRKTRGLK